MSKSFKRWMEVDLENERGGNEGRVKLRNQCQTWTQHLQKHIDSFVIPTAINKYL